MRRWIFCSTCAYLILVTLVVSPTAFAATDVQGVIDNLKLWLMGFLASLANSQLWSQSDTIGMSQYYPRTDLVPGQTVYASGGVGYRQLTVKRERTGVSSALQWRSPEGSVDANLQYFYSHATWKEDEDALGNTPGQTLSGSNLTFASGLLTGGTINDAGWNGDARYTTRAANNKDTALHVNWRPSAA